MQVGMPKNFFNGCKTRFLQLGSANIERSLRTSEIHFEKKSHLGFLC